MIKKAQRYYHTLKYLKPVQFWSRLTFPFKVRYANYRLPSWFISLEPAGNLNLKESINAPESWKGEGGFFFLNTFHRFEPGAIDWNFTGEGKLWQYNLRYFDYLGQPDMNRDQGLQLIHQFIDAMEKREILLEPYPVSLRCINWIKFIARYKIEDNRIDKAIYAQINFLRYTLETHLLANHLLENLMAWLFGAVYFQKDDWFSKIEKMLAEQLNEQILDDGGHYELSPMYHNILLYRILDGINLLSGSNRLKEVKSLFIHKAEKMLAWSEKVSFKNGRIPYFNDSTDGVAYSIQKLEKYARDLGVEKTKITLEESGYRKFEAGNSELIMDVGEIGIDYQPGHVHCDMLSFELHQDGIPVVVNTGVSTYERGPRRELERSTSSHNTVSVGNLEQSDVWSAFRVGKRANMQRLQESDRVIAAKHDGYLEEGGGIHSRSFSLDDSHLAIEDHLSQKKTKLPPIAYFHLHPGVELIKESTGTYLVNGRKWTFQAFTSIEIQDYQWAAGFNKLVSSKRLAVEFEQQLKTEIEL